ncbi:squalene synthase HpnC, partial [Streptomyces chartreusis]
RNLLNDGTPLWVSFHGIVKLLLAGFVAGGRAAIGAIAAAEYDVLPGPPKASKLRLLREVGVTLRGEG